MKNIQGNPLPLGVTVSETYINFAAVAREGVPCHLLLYRENEREPAREIPMEQSMGAIRYLALKRPLTGFCGYNFRIGDDVTPDPYVKRILGKERWMEDETQEEAFVCGALETETFDWEGDQPLRIPEHETVAYSLHVRGFTSDRGACVRKKGTFEGVIEKIPYLTELGVNRIHAMPVYEFDEAGALSGRVNYWGYGPAYPFAVKNAYSASGNGPKSLKKLVKALHRAGIELVLEMPFDASIPRPAMIECLRVYRMEYHIDGFILNPLLAPLDVLYQDPALADTKLLHHDSAFPDTMRRFLKGDEGMIPEVMYRLRHTSRQEGTFNEITTQSGFTLEDLVSYDRKHNEANGENNTDGTDYNFSWNCGAEGPTRKKDIRMLRERQVRNAFLLLLLAQGTPCILSGDELGNSQQGNNNAYCQDNPVGWLSWMQRRKHPELPAFVRRVIEVRKTYAAFTPEKEMSGADRGGYGVPDISWHGENAWRVPSERASRQLGVFYSAGEKIKPDIYVIYNMHWLEHRFALPSLHPGGKWRRILSTDSVAEDAKPLPDQKFLDVKPRTIVILVGEKA